MSTSATEQGQEPGRGAGDQGQEPGAGGQGQEPGQQGQNQGGADDGTQSPDLSTIADPNLRAWVEARDKAAREASRDAARYRTERNTLQQSLTAAQQAGETAEQTAQREAQEAKDSREALERENRELKVGSKLNTAAASAKAHNPARVTELLMGKVETDDNGQPTNLEALLRDLRKSDPYLFQKPANNDAGAGNGDGGAPPTGDMNDMIRNMRGARRGRTSS